MVLYLIDNAEEVNKQLTWERQIPVLFCPQAITGVLRVWLAGLVGLLAVLLGAGYVKDGMRAGSAVQTVALTIVVFVCLFVVVLTAVALFNKNTFRAQYALDNNGVYYSITPTRTHNTPISELIEAYDSRTCIYKMILSSGLQQCGFIAWSDVYSVKDNAINRVIVLKNTWRTLLHIHCTEELFDEATRATKKAYASFEEERIKALELGIQKKNLTLRRTFSISTLLALLASLAALTNPLLDMDVYGKYVTLTGLLVIVGCVYGGYGFRVLRGLAAAAALWHAGFVFAIGLHRVYIVPGVLWHTRFYMYSDTPDAVWVVISAIGALILLFVSTRNLLKAR